MINWDEFEHIHVIKKLKQILNSWWNIDTVFTDEKGRLRGFDVANPKLINPAAKLFLTKDTPRESLVDVVNKAVEDLRVSGNRYSIRKWDTTGFDIAVVPIVIDNEFMGAVVSLGFLKDSNVGGCLLYTSPSPRDRQKSRMPSSA